MYFIELIGFIQYYWVLKRPFLKECVPKKCRKIYAQIPPQVGFVPPPYGGVHIPSPMAKSLWPTLQCGGGYRTFHLGGDTTHEVRETQEGWTGRVKRYKGYTSNLGCMVGKMNNKKNDHSTQLS